MTVQFDILEETAPVPAVARRGRVAAGPDPKVVALYNDTLKPRGVPSSNALVLKAPSIGDADKTVRELRDLAAKDEPRVSVGKKIEPVNADAAEGEQRVTVWLTKYTPRQKKSDTVVEAAPVVEKTSEPEPETNAPAEPTVAFVEPESAHDEPKKRNRWSL
jgi:hypothetical protein